MAAAKGTAPAPGGSTLDRLPPVAKVGVGFLFVVLIGLLYFVVFYSDVDNDLTQAQSEGGAPQGAARRGREVARGVPEGRRREDPPRAAGPRAEEDPPRRRRDADLPLDPPGRGHRVGREPHLVEPDRGGAAGVLRQGADEAHPLRQVPPGGEVLPRRRPAGAHHQHRGHPHQEDGKASTRSTSSASPPPSARPAPARARAAEEQDVELHSDTLLAAGDHRARRGRSPAAAATSPSRPPKPRALPAPPAAAAPPPAAQRGPLRRRRHAPAPQARLPGAGLRRVGRQPRSVPRLRRRSRPGEQDDLHRPAAASSSTATPSRSSSWWAWSTARPRGRCSSIPPASAGSPSVGDFVGKPELVHSGGPTRRRRAHQLARRPHPRGRRRLRPRGPFPPRDPAHHPRHRAAQRRRQPRQQGAGADGRGANVLRRALPPGPVPKLHHELGPSGAAALASPEPRTAAFARQTPKDSGVR